MSVTGVTATSDSGTSRAFTVCDLFDQQSGMRPHSVAIRTPDSSWTYADVRGLTTRLGRGLACAGIGRGDLVGLLAPLGPAALVGLVAILRCGAACMPLDPDDPPRRLKRIAADAGCVRILAASPADWCPDALLIDLSQPDGEDQSASELTGPTPLDLAYAITTSGSTGRPKAVAIPHEALFNLITTSIEDFGLLAGQDIVLWLSRPTVDVTMQDCLMALCSGAAVAIPEHDGFLPRAVLTAARALGATVVDIPAAVIGAYGQALLPRLARIGVRLVITGGSRLDGAGLLGATDPPTVFNAYGPTETTVTATLYRCTDSTPRWPPIGRPIRGVRTYVLDDRLAPVPVGEEGQLYIAGKGVGWGYLGQPGRTASVFLPDPLAEAPGQRMYATGDRVRRRPDGDLEFLDRMDNQVKLRGFRIEVGEVEHSLCECPEVREAAVLVREDVPGGAALVAFLVGDRTPAEVLRNRLRERLPHYMMPSVYVWMDDMPLNRQGKPDRKALTTLSIQGAVPRGGS